jgi:hypothetical protein
MFCLRQALGAGAALVMHKDSGHATDGIEHVAEGEAAIERRGRGPNRGAPRAVEARIRR